MTEHLQQSWGFTLVATTIRSTQKPSRCLWNDRAWELRVEQTQSQRNITIDFNCCQNMTEHLQQSWGLCFLQHHHNWEQLETSGHDTMFSLCRVTHNTLHSCELADKVCVLVGQPKYLTVITELERSLGIGRTVSLQIRLNRWTVSVEVS